MVRQNPAGKMLLSAERVSGTLSSAQYANRTRKILQGMGFKTRTPQPHPSGAYYLDFFNKRSHLRQALLVVDGIGYALTLSAPTRADRVKHLRSFEAALQSISIDRGKKDDPKPAKGKGPTKSEPDEKKKP